MATRNVLKKLKNSHSFTFTTFATFTNFATITTFTTFTLSFTLSRHAEQLLFSCLWLYAQKSLSHSFIFVTFTTFIESVSTCF